MFASRHQALFALWALMLMVGVTAQASGSRALLQDTLGLGPCNYQIHLPGGNIISAAQLASHCPHDGQAYAVCVQGAAQGGCRLEAQGKFPAADCQDQCFFHST